MNIEKIIYLIFFLVILGIIIDILLTARKYKNIKKSFENNQFLLIGYNGIFEKISKKDGYKLLNINNEKYLTNGIKYFQIYNNKITIKILDEINN